MILGCIADDFTGATDLANNLVRAGLRTVQAIGVPSQAIDGADAVVVALKSRTAPVADAVAQSLAAARWLRGQGARRLYFKVCSTFDSTAEGNIGPVAEALIEFTGAPVVPVTPAFPAAGRTVYRGHLFVGDVLLSDSPMRHHPLTPMNDANLVRVLQAQCRRERVGLVAQRGAEAMRAQLHSLAAQGTRLAIVDAIGDDDLHALAAAAHELPLLVAGSGLAIGIPAQLGFAPNAQAAALPPARGHGAIVSGSCSAQTLAQMADFKARGGAVFTVDPLRIVAGHDGAAEALAFAVPRLGDAPVLVAASAEPTAVKAVQAQLGVQQAGALVEATLARIALGLVEAGVGRLVIAGGETSGACVQALGLTRLRIGPQIDTGVPWCHAPERSLHIALKSGNFGDTAFFSRAFTLL